MTQFRLSTPLTYYGGKQKLVPIILPMIPEHITYCEPFAGGAAPFFSKPPSEVEILNDTNKLLINFYRVVQNQFYLLAKEINLTLYSRSSYRKAWMIYSNPEHFDSVEKAWAVWILCAQGFSGKLSSTWGFDKTRNTSVLRLRNKIKAFTKDLALRLQNVQLEEADALYVIESRDHKDAFFYCDPPYPNSDCGHYDGYSMDDFESLLKVLSKIKGKFLLSSYNCDILKKYSEKYKWYTQVFEQGVAVNTKVGYQKKKWEVLTSSYPIPGK